MNIKKDHKRKGVSEHIEQSQLFQWVELQKGKHPELEMLFSIPNQGISPNRNTAIRYGAKKKREGLRAGVPDMLLAYPHGIYHGLFIEMKVGYNKPKDEQLWWLEKLKEQGYCVWVCYSAEDAQDVILAYLNNRIVSY